MPIDAGNRLAWNDDIDINPEANDSSNNKQAKESHDSPRRAALNLNLFNMGKVLPPSKIRGLPSRRASMCAVCLWYLFVLFDRDDR